MPDTLPTIIRTREEMYLPWPDGTTARDSDGDVLTFRGGHWRFGSFDSAMGGDLLPYTDVKLPGWIEPDALLTDHGIDLGGPDNRPFEFDSFAMQGVTIELTREGMEQLRERLDLIDATENPLSHIEAYREALKLKKRTNSDGVERMVVSYDSAGTVVHLADGAVVTQAQYNAVRESLEASLATSSAFGGHDITVPVEKAEGVDQAFHTFATNTRLLPNTEQYIGARRAFYSGSNAAHALRDQREADVLGLPPLATTSGPASELPTGAHEGWARHRNDFPEHNSPTGREAYVAGWIDAARVEPASYPLPVWGPDATAGQIAESIPDHLFDDVRTELTKIAVDRDERQRMRVQSHAYANAVLVTLGQKTALTPEDKATLHAAIDQHEEATA